MFTRSGQMNIDTIRPRKIQFRKNDFRKAYEISYEIFV
jgi:hypothetical protein